MSSVAQFSLAHYEYMVGRGVFPAPAGSRLELIEGAIVKKDSGRPATFTVDEYEQMIRAGAFDPPFDIPAELIEGAILMMSPIGEAHSQAIIALNEWSYDVVDRKGFAVRVQMPIRIPAAQSEPEPDLVWVQRKGPTQKPPEPERVVLIVEVAESSLEYDRTVKLPIYSQAGIPEYWIVNLLERQIEVYRQPSGNSYQSKTIHGGQEAISPLAFPEASLLPRPLVRAAITLGEQRHWLYPGGKTANQIPS